MTLTLHKRFWMFLALCVAIAPAAFAQRSSSGYSGYGAVRAVALAVAAATAEAALVRVAAAVPPVARAIIRTAR